METHLTRVTETLRIGLGIADAGDLWRERASRIVGGSIQSPSGPGDDPKVIEWTSAGLRGRAELSSDGDSTLVRLTLSGDDAKAEMDRVLSRLSLTLDDVDSVEGVGYGLEPDADASPDEQTSPDQPL